MTRHYAASVAMPGGRSRPSAFGMYTRREGTARQRPCCTRSCKSRRLASRSSPQAPHVTPSPPARPSG
jgi:hypothetical protein